MVIRIEPGSPPEDSCVCGAVHHVPIDEVVIDDRAFERLVAYAVSRRWSRPFVVMDANTEEVAGSRVVEELSSANMRVTMFCYPERSGLLADERNVSRLEAALKQGESDSIFAVGSGVITDLARYVANRIARDFVSVPTAASMDGYASSAAAMEFGGMKTTYPAVSPVAIFAEPLTIAAAPIDMTRAGIGDLLGKASAGTDWRASHALYGEYLCPEVERRMTESFVGAATHVTDILGGSPEAVSGLLRGLVESGIAIAMVGNSRPASGCEHQVSHFWDLLAANHRRPHASHGLQVGYATHFAMDLERYAFGGPIRALIPPRPVTLDGEVDSWFAGHGAQVEAVVEERRRFLAEHVCAWPKTASDWESVQDQVGEAMDVFPLVAEALSVASIPPQPGFLGLDAATLRASFRWANRIRPRYTVLDFLEGQGRLDEAIEAVLPPLSAAS
ncbi:MAG: sn-glycerol-1-phosphate dehydrogenase [Acidimicrobiales bacterium]